MRKTWDSRACMRTKTGAGTYTRVAWNSPCRRSDDCRCTNRMKSCTWDGRLEWSSAGMWESDRWAYLCRIVVELVVVGCRREAQTVEVECKRAFVGDKWPEWASYTIEFVEVEYTTTLVCCMKAARVSGSLGSIDRSSRVD